MYGGMLSVHSTSRDQYGVPIVRNIVKVPMGSDSSEEKLAKKHWNEVHQSLRLKTADIRRLEERIEFFKNWSLRYLTPLRHTFIQVNSTIRSPKDTHLEDELAVLEGRQKSANAKWKEISFAMEILMRNALNEILDFPLQTPSDPFQQPWTLMRFWHKSSHTAYSDSLGFQCSGWRTCKPADSFTKLKDDGILTTQQLQNHCKGTVSPSHWISLCDDASWMLKYIDKTSSTTDGRVAIVSLPKLDRLNIPWGRSDMLVQQAGGKCYSDKHLDDVQYAWNGHYLVYGWIPAQCVIKTFSIQHFQQLCEEHDIKKGQHLTSSLGMWIAKISMKGDLEIRYPHLLLQPPPASTTNFGADLLASALEDITTFGDWHRYPR